MKLSKVQEAVLNEAKTEVNKFRQYGSLDKYLETQMDWIEQGGTEEDRESRKEYCERVYNEAVNGIAKIWRCNSKTIRKLEELGLIEILFDSAGIRAGMDKIKVLGY